MGLLDEAIDLARVTGHRHREAALLNNLADLHHRSGSTEAAEETLTKAVTLFSDIDSQQWQLELWLISHW